MSDLIALMETPNLDAYDNIVVAFSGGKDSLACALHLLDRGVDPARIELWHHDVDGGDAFMDWPCTPAYCDAVADALDIVILHSRKHGGFRREMLRDGSATAPVTFETITDDGIVEVTVGGKGPAGTRLKFPQVSANLSVRWCSAYLKIDVADLALKNDPRFRGQRTLVLTGERAEESPSRARYKTFEPHRSDLRNGKKYTRHIDHWRPVHDWSEAKVWALIQEFGVVPHPAYRLGWGRLSCMSCIFGNANQWASVRRVAPERFEEIARYEEQFGTTIQRKLSVRQLADRGVAYDGMTHELVELAMNTAYTSPVQVSSSEWQMPLGAFGENAGPT